LQYWLIVSIRIYQTSYLRKGRLNYPHLLPFPYEGEGKKKGLIGGGKMLEEYIPQLKELEKKIDELRGYL